MCANTSTHTRVHVWYRRSTCKRQYFRYVYLYTYTDTYTDTYRYAYKCKYKESTYKRQVTGTD